MKLSSSDFEDSGIIPEDFTCKGDNFSPQLTISEVPPEAKSLCLILNDPDAVGEDFNHWLVWNIDPGTTEIAENSLPMGSVEGTTSYGKVGYGGPCPPAGTGTHRYMFELYALDTSLELPESTNEAALRVAISGHTLAESTLTGLVSNQA